MMHSNSNPRSALLSGLRTGGVRSTSQPSIAPHTAAIGGSFNMHRHPSYTQQHSLFPEEDDELADMLNYSMQLNGGGNPTGHQRIVPASAGPVNGGNRFQQQQQTAFLQQMAAQRSLNGVNGMGIPGFGAVDPMQMQLMQLELMKLQALQQAQQQYQAELELMAQTQRQQQLQQQQQRGPSRRQSAFGEQPATAGPGQTSFDIHGAPQFSRNQGESFDIQEVPKTAALSGKFGGRPVLSALNPNATVFTMSTIDEPSTPKTATPGNTRTTVISGGTSLGGVSTPVHASTPATPSKSDSATSWRRPNVSANGASPMTPTRPSAGTPILLSSPSARLSLGGDDSFAPSPLRQRPSPLRFDGGNMSVSIEAETGSESDLDYYTANLAHAAASSSSVSDNERDSSPGTPPSAGSSTSISREEASKRLYEGLGMGRPVQLHVPPVHIPLKQQVTQVIRQPRGPPAAVDELGPRNFAARMQKKLVVAV